MAVNSFNWLLVNITSDYMKQRSIHVPLTIFRWQGFALYNQLVSFQVEEIYGVLLPDIRCLKITSATTRHISCWVMLMLLQLLMKQDKEKFCGIIRMHHDIQKWWNITLMLLFFSLLRGLPFEVMMSQMNHQIGAIFLNSLMFWWTTAMNSVFFLTMNRLHIRLMSLKTNLYSVFLMKLDVKFKTE